ncbi:dihydroneopterin aldolase [Balneolaceae bacterium ANBcel3]|nr:dihydroneopterin aldolase [Balneolaceae bacterium ANBcel3]
MDCITIKNLRIHANHGVYPEERESGNTFETDILIWRELEFAAQTDKLEHTCDYSIAASIVSEVLNSEPVQLLETLVYRIGNRLMASFPEARKIEVALRKCTPPMDLPCDYTEVRSQWPR